MHAVILLFAICSGPDPAFPDALSACEEGSLAAQSCVIAERYIRAGLRPGQHLHVWRCEVLS